MIVMALSSLVSSIISTTDWHEWVCNQRQRSLLRLPLPCCHLHDYSFVYTDAGVYPWCSCNSRLKSDPSSSSCDSSLKVLPGTLRLCWVRLLWYTTSSVMTARNTVKTPILFFIMDWCLLSLICKDDDSDKGGCWVPSCVRRLEISCLSKNIFSSSSKSEILFCASACCLAKLLLSEADMFDFFVLMGRCCGGGCDWLARDLC